MTRDYIDRWPRRPGDLELSGMQGTRSKSASLVRANLTRRLDERSAGPGCLPGATVRLERGLLLFPRLLAGSRETAFSCGVGCQLSPGIAPLFDGILILSAG